MDNVRHLPPNESPEARLPELTENEKRVTGLLARGRPLVEIASEMGMSFDEALELVLGVFMKLKPASFPEPPPRSPAAAAALAVPQLRAEDIPRHVGRPLQRRPPAPDQIS
jgi:hypothetical protein